MQILKQFPNSDNYLAIYCICKSLKFGKGSKCGFRKPKIPDRLKNFSLPGVICSLGKLQICIYLGINLEFLGLAPACQYLSIAIYCNLYKYGFSITMIKDVFGSVLHLSEIRAGYRFGSVILNLEAMKKDIC